MTQSSNDQRIFWEPECLQTLGPDACPVGWEVFLPDGNIQKHECAEEGEHDNHRCACGVEIEADP